MTLQQAIEIGLASNQGKQTDAKQAAYVLAVNILEMAEELCDTKAKIVRMCGEIIAGVTP